MKRLILSALIILVFGNSFSQIRLLKNLNISTHVYFADIYEAGEAQSTFQSAIPGLTSLIDANILAPECSISDLELGVVTMSCKNNVLINYSVGTNDAKNGRALVRIATKKYGEPHWAEGYAGGMKFYWIRNTLIGTATTVLTVDTPEIQVNLSSSINLLN